MKRVWPERYDERATQNRRTSKRGVLVVDVVNVEIDDDTSLVILCARMVFKVIIRERGH